MKDQGYDARYVFIAPLSLSELKTRLSQKGSDSEQMQGQFQAAEQEIEQSRIEGFYDKFIDNNLLESAYELLERYIFEGHQDQDELSQSALQGAEATLEAVDTGFEMINGEGSSIEDRMAKKDAAISLTNDTTETDALPPVA